MTDTPETYKGAAIKNLVIKTANGKAKTNDDRQRSFNEVLVAGKSIKRNACKRD